MDVMVKDFGALGDGFTNDTQAFMNAFKHCSDFGGGRVVVEEGCYRIGLLQFYSHIELHLKKGAHLLASNHLEDFDLVAGQEIKLVDIPTFSDCDYDGKPTKYFIYAYRCHHIAITGEGTIDGNETIFYGKETKWHIDGFFYPRMPLIFFEDCHDILIKDVKLTKSAFWTTHLVGCKNVLIEHVFIENNLRLANCDGIDPDHCQHVIIRGCHISAADDCIVFKTTSAAKKYGPCEDILVEDCTLISTSAAIKFGTESVSDFKNIKIKNCHIMKSNRGICLQLRDEGSISDVSFENLTIETRRFSPEYWWGKAEPIIITAVRRDADTKVGKIHHIFFSNIKMSAENGIFIYGMQQNITDISFHNLSLELKSKTNWPKNTYDLRPSEYGILESINYPVYLNSCKTISMEHFSVKLDETIQNDLSNDIFLFDVVDIKMNASDLLCHLDNVHTTPLGLERIVKNTGLTDPFTFLRQHINNKEASILLKGKNYYVYIKDYKFTIHHTSFTLITAHRSKK